MVVLQWRRGMFVVLAVTCLKLCLHQRFMANHNVFVYASDDTHS